jgi:hypothetical protein
MAQSRRWMDSGAGKATVLAIVLMAVGLCVWAITGAVHGDTPGDPSSSTYVCSETGKAFKHHNVLGESMPIMSPYSGKETGYPAEPCYWNADGTIKTEPTWVILNKLLGKPGPTFCPDCGRLVIAHNPTPSGPGAKPPPTKTELMHSVAGANDGSR